MMINVPEPMPTDQPHSVEVLELVKQDIKYFQELRKQPLVDIPDFSSVIPALEARSDYGFAKYGTRLRVPNGRSFKTDCLQEIADAIVYWRGYIELDNIRPELDPVYFQLLSLFVDIDAHLNEV